MQSQIDIIKAVRPKLTMQQLVELANPEPIFEFTDGQNWFYTVKSRDEFGEGFTLEGNLICVNAPSPLLAEQLAYDGLIASIEQFNEYLSLGIDTDADTRPITN